MRVRVGVVHEKLKFDAKRSNAKKLGEHIRRLVDEYDVNLVILPPYLFYGPLSVYGEAKARKVAWSNAERITVGPSKAKQGSATTLLAKWSFEYNVYIVGGPIIERAGPRVYMSVVVTSPRGIVMGKHRKIVLNNAEEGIGISAGRTIEVVRLDRYDLTIALFIDEDILVPDIFKLARLSSANMIIGLMMPHPASSLPIERDSSGVLGYRKEIIYSLAVARSVETGLPLVVAGGAIEVENGGLLLASPTIPVEPETGVLETKVKGLSELGVPLVIEIDTVASRPRLLGLHDIVLSKEVCRCVDKLAESLVSQSGKASLEEGY
ncbi:MAG: carbon-nitrogen hydrolase family protein [Acidilobaceae archaeon]